MNKRTLRIAGAASAAAIGAAVGVVGTMAPSAAAGPNSFTLHLVCDNGNEYDVFINDEHTVAAHIQGSKGIAVLKNGNGTGVPAFVTGPHAGTLVNCDTGIPGFTALVMFTPRGHG
jgi:hypothetical protein